MYVYYKVSIWNKIAIPIDKIDSFLSLLDKGKVNNIDNVLDFLEGDVDVEPILDTEESLTIIDNDNQSTLDVYESNNIIYNNVDKVLKV